MESKAKKKGSGIALFSVLSVLFAVLFAAACIGTQLAFASSQAVNIALQTSTFATKNTDDEAVYFESDFDSVEELEAHDKEIAEQLTGEGARPAQKRRRTAPGCGQQGQHPEPFLGGHRDLRHRLCGH